ncbi:MAG: hypothetical protein U0172_03485 [Nitrospiraceae bacterium]
MARSTDILVRILADSAKLLDEFDRSGKAAEQFQSSIARGAQIAEKAAFALAAGIAAVGTALATATISAANQGDAFKKMAEKAGESVERMSALSYAADLSGISHEQLGQALQKLAKHMNDTVHGNHESAQAFGLLDIAITRTDGTLRPAIDVMLDASDRLAQMKDGTKAAAMAQELFTKSGADLLPLLKQGSASIREQMLEANALGVVWSGTAAAAAEQFNDNLNKLQAGLQGIANAIGQALIPKLNVLVEAMLEWIKANREWLAAQIVAAIEKAAASTISFAASVYSAVEALNSLIKTPFVQFLVRVFQVATDIAFIIGNVLVKGVMAFIETVLKIGQTVTFGKMSENFSAAAREVEFMREAATLMLKSDWQSLIGHLTDVKTESEKTSNWFDQALANIQRMTAATRAQITATSSGVVETRNLAVEELRAAIASEMRVAAMKDADQALGTLIDTEYQANQVQFQAIKRNTKAEEERWTAIKAILDLYPEMNLLATEANAIVEHNKAVAEEVLAVNKHAHSEQLLRIAALEDERAGMESEFNLQRAWYSQAPGFIGQADEARRKGYALIEKTFDLERMKLEETIAQGELTHAEATGRMMQLEMDTAAKRIQLMQQFPTAFESQMQALVNSNSFSLSSITTQWTGATAAWIRGVGDFKQVTESTLQSLLQAFLNFGVQQLAQWALVTTQQVALESAKETAMTAAATAGAASRTAVTSAEAATEVGIMTGAQTTILAMFAAVGGALQALFLEVLVPAIVAVGEFVIGVLSAIAEAMMDTVFGIPIGLAIIAGIVGIVAALAATGNLPKLGDGGIVTGPTTALIGERGPEAVIPLDRLAEVGGSGGGQTIVLNVDGREMQRWLLDNMHSYVRLRTGVLAT